MTLIKTLEEADNSFSILIQLSLKGTYLAVGINLYKLTFLFF